MPDITLERPMPSDLEVERAVLGAVLLSPPALCEACEACGRDDIHLDGHRRIFHALPRLQASEVAIDCVPLNDLPILFGFVLMKLIAWAGRVGNDRVVGQIVNRKKARFGRQRL